MSKLKILKYISATKFFLFLTVLFAPLYVVRFRIGGYPSTLLEVLIGLTVVAWVVERLRGREGQKFNFSIALFVLAAAVSVVVSPDKRGALGIFKAYFVEPILIFFIIKDVVKSKKDWWLLFSALVLSGLWIALLAVFQGLTGQFTFALHEAVLGRAHAVYNTANAVGLYLGPIIFLLLGAIKRTGDHSTSEGRLLNCQIVKLLGIGLMVVAIALSKSAGAVVGLVGALGVWGLFRVFGPEPHWVRGKGKLLVGLGLLAVVAVGIWFFFNISNLTPKNVDPYVRKSTNTLQFRLCLWEGTRDMLLDRPIFGSGLSGFKELYSQQYFTCDAETLEYPHNWVLNFWTEIGFLGLVGFLLLLVMYFRNVGSRLSDKRTRWLALGFAAAMVYWLVHGLVDVPYFKNDLSLEFWVIVGLLETLCLAGFEGEVFN